MSEIVPLKHVSRSSVWTLDHQFGH